MLNKRSIGDSAQCEAPTLNGRYRQPSIRERLEGRKAQLEGEIVKVDLALSTLTPDIEKAMDALSNVNY